MHLFRSFLGLGLVLSFALLAPVALPAGGGRERTQIRRCNSAGARFIQETCSLRVSPFKDAISLRNVKAGTPIHVLRAWEDSCGSNWLHIQIITFESPQSVVRGWVNV